MPAAIGVARIGGRRPVLPTHHAIAGLCTWMPMEDLGQGYAMVVLSITEFLKMKVMLLAVFESRVRKVRVLQYNVLQFCHN